MTVVVVGGGIVGTTVAWRLAAAGDDVTVVDPGARDGAWHVAAGMVAPVLEAAPGDEDLLRLSIASARSWPAFAADLEDATGTAVGFEPAGTLLVARDRDDLEVLRDTLAFQRVLGLDVTPLSATACRDREPHLAPAIRGGILASEDHRVDPRRVVAAAHTAGERAGVARRRGRVARVDGDGRRVTGVTLDDGTTLRAETVVLATGSATTDLDGVPERLRRAVRPVKGELLVLRAADGVPVVGSAVRAVVHGRPVYLVPREDGRLVVGATQDERDDRTVTAGSVRRLLDDAVEVVPAVDEHEVVEMLAGLRPGTVDGRPLIGPTEITGLLAATGHHRHGVLLAPITAATVVAHVAGTAPPPEVAVADPGRLTPIHRRTTEVPA